MAEQSEIGQGAQVGDAMLPVAERGSHGEGEVVGGGRGVERAEGADDVAPSAQPIDQAVVLQASEGVGGGGRRAIERGPGFVEGELLLALGDEGVNQLKWAGHRCLLIVKIAEVHEKREIQPICLTRAVIGVQVCPKPLTWAIICTGPLPA